MGRRMDVRMRGPTPLRHSPSLRSSEEIVYAIRFHQRERIHVCVSESNKSAFHWQGPRKSDIGQNESVVASRRALVGIGVAHQLPEAVTPAGGVSVAVGAT